MFRDGSLVLFCFILKGQAFWCKIKIEILLHFILLFLFLANLMNESDQVLSIKTVEQ